ncbi:hypothetical protein PoB_005444100 [Plakobranchus ocellatus]|uniref:Uncharacterized protein n=1 Tax=Plakobranchus ocellatus TaxID=259542 RepID=A0AAV4C5E0_9GAST|nr:hypothetical protein PoB_005444100 [Plakobranchus ocellatus]
MACCWLHGLLCSLRNGGQPNNHVRYDHLATSNTHSSRFLTPVLAVVIALALITAHWERDVRSDIKSQVPRTYSTWRPRAVKARKGRHAHQSRKVLRLPLAGNGEAPRPASVQSFFATSGCGEGSRFFFCLVMRRVLGFSSGFPARHGAQPGGHVARHSRAVSGLPWSYTPSRERGTSTGLTSIRVAPYGKQGAHNLGVGLSIILSTGGLRWIELEDSMRRSGRDDSA